MFEQDYCLLEYIFNENFLQVPDLNMQNIRCPENLSQTEKDAFWMHYVMQLAAKAEAIGEVPVGAAVVLNDELIAEGWNQSITLHDPTAHAEIIALRKAGESIGNYRLVETTLYVTLEPCPMCAGAMVHARVKRLVFGAFDQKTGAAGSILDIADCEHLNHQLEISGGVKQMACSQQISDFFKKRRAYHKMNKAQKQTD